MNRSEDDHAVIPQMSGSAHYREAEQLIRHVEGLHPSDDASGHLALAQVHATLALAAATVWAGGGSVASGDPTPDIRHDLASNFKDVRRM